MPQFYIIGSGIVNGNNAHGVGILYQCGKIIKGDYDGLVEAIRRECREVGGVLINGAFSIVTVRDYGDYKGFIARIPCISNTLSFTTFLTPGFRYYARIYRASDHIRITVPKSILPDGIDPTGWIGEVHMRVDNIFISFTARIRAGRKKNGRVLYYFIRIPRRRLRKLGLSEDELVGREAEVILTMRGPQAPT